ncbi:hypothetical protein [Sphingomonas sp. 28-62-11]|uniref:hypothetical protein n=1 Tax=Sphingomonas sp. 28-62-11 TaxID=1970432 RepID=UPI000BCDA6EA|nr:MAG: hypothetical protein B7Y49_07450 [Sphingomonas sp. 28-62-11]
MSNVHQLVLSLISGLAILALLTVPILTARSNAQTAEAPAWWRLMSEQLQCTAAAHDPTEKRCVDPRPLVKNDTAYRGEGLVAVRVKDAENPGDARKKVVVGIEFLSKFGGELIYDSSNANAHRLAGFGVGSYSHKSTDCPAATAVMVDILRVAGIPGRPAGTIENCTWSANRMGNNQYKTAIHFSAAVELKPAASTRSTCTTALLQGTWRADGPQLANTGHAVSFTAAPNMPKHDGGQIAMRGVFSTYPKYKHLLGIVPTPMFTDSRGFVVGKDQCLIPVVVNMRDSGTSRSAALIDTRTSSLRFVTNQAYRWTGKGFQIDAAAITSNAVSGAPGRWLRGAAEPEAKSCKPNDFNGRWDRSDGAKITIRGTGTDGVGGYATMDENPGRWVRGQDKYVSMRMKEACVYTAQCNTTQRKVVNGRSDFTMTQKACELVLDPVQQTLRERGTTNTYVYKRAGSGAAAPSNPQSPRSAAPRPAERDESYRTAAESEPASAAKAAAAAEAAAAATLNAQQAAAAKRDILAFEARKKAVAAQQAANLRAYQKALADREAKIAEINRKAQEDQARWRAAVAACAAGDRSQCAPQP